AAQSQIFRSTPGIFRTAPGPFRLSKVHPRKAKCVLLRHQAGWRSSPADSFWCLTEQLGKTRILRYPTIQGFEAMLQWFSPGNFGFSVTPWISVRQVLFSNPFSAGSYKVYKHDPSAGDE